MDEDFFMHGSQIECLECDGIGKRKRKPKLTMLRHNYSGSGVDIGACVKCGKAWCIDYTINKMEIASDWDIDTEGVREQKLLKEKEKKEKKEKSGYLRLKEIYGKEEE